MAAARAELESLLRARRLDATLAPAAAPRDRDGLLTAPTGWEPLDGPLGGGLRRGHLSEIVGASSSGRSAVLDRLAAAATSRGEAVALVDTHDRFDPASAAAAGVDLRRLLWVRETGGAERALKAMMLVLQAGGFGVAALDLTDVPARVLRQFPHTTWLRMSRAIEGSPTAAVIMAAEHLARSAGGATIVLEPPGATAAGEWQGTGARARRLAGLHLRPRVVSLR